MHRDLQKKDKDQTKDQKIEIDLMYPPITSVILMVLP